MTYEEELDEKVVTHLNIIVEEIWDEMNARPAGTDSITLDGQEINVSVLEKVSDEVEILSFSKDLDILLMKVHSLVGHKYFLGYVIGIDSAVQIRLNQILKNINT
jgi:hypothetical protein